ncbi:MAG: DUF3192 domain-containing protein [Shewanella sp.]|uniref:DUF3192 domain-containing protein n=1 Tax=Shewanella sp. TaxID=50422 RepID=UPI003F310705
MKSTAFVIFGCIFAAYVAFVAVVALVYQPTPDEMSWEDRQLFINQTINHLSLGQNRAEITALLGNADFSEAKSINETQLLVLFYRTHHQQSDGVTTKDECTPLLFQDDKLIAWGNETYKQYLAAGADLVRHSPKATDPSSKN